jgi:hypothetical protein
MTSKLILNKYRLLMGEKEKQLKLDSAIDIDEFFILGSCVKAERNL